MDVFNSKVNGILDRWTFQTGTYDQSTSIYVFKGSISKVTPGKSPVSFPLITSKWVFQGLNSAKECADELFLIYALHLSGKSVLKLDISTFSIVPDNPPCA